MKDLKTVEHSKAIRELGLRIVRGIVETGGKYFELCQYIRQERIHPKVVSEELRAVGFSSKGVSQINRVANASDYFWDKYQARQLGFKGVLTLTRHPVQVEFAKQAKVGLGTIQKLVADDLAERKADRNRSPDPERDFNAAGAKVLTLAELLGLPDGWERRADGYVLRIRRTVNVTPLQHCNTEAQDAN